MKEPLKLSKTSYTSQIHILAQYFMKKYVLHIKLWRNREAYTIHGIFVVLVTAVFDYLSSFDSTMGKSKNQSDLFKVHVIFFPASDNLQYM